VVVAHGSSTLPACAGGLTGAGVPFVYRQISDSLFWAPTALRRPRRLALGRARRVVALAEQPAAVLVEHFGVRRDHLDIIPNGVPAGPYAPAGPVDRRAARAALGVPAGATVVLSISALAPEKGVDLVIDAVADLDDPDVALLMVGDGPERSALAARAGRRLGARAKVTGPLDDVAAAYAAADIVVLASRGGDSMPATLIEASFAGCALIATPVGSITEIVVDGDTGVVVPIGMRARCATLARLVDAPADRARLGAPACERSSASRSACGPVLGGHPAPRRALTDARRTTTGHRAGSCAHEHPTARLHRDALRHAQAPLPSPPG
jgi:glycosyltransferase involved in cell wall biosynthesis